MNSLEGPPSSKSTDSKLGPPGETPAEDRPAMSGTVNGPPPDAFSYAATPQTQGPPSASAPSRTSTSKTLAPPPVEVSTTEFIPEVSPQPGKELTLFLQYKSKIKKIVLPDGSNDLSMAKLQLAFIEKFAWNTHNNGVELPEIYIQDSISGVRHELDDLSDVKDRSVLVLNIEPLDEIKKHFDESIGNIRKLVEGVKSSVDGQQIALSQVSDRQQDSAKDLARLAAAPTTPRSTSSQINGSARSPIASESALREVSTLRRDLAIMRQTLTSFTRSVQTSMAAIRNKADAVKAKAVDVSIPTFDGDSGRAYVNNGKKTLGDDSDTLVNRVDDLQDIVEDLRKDVVNRGVRPLARQLEAANKDIKEGTKELKKMQEYVKREKPIWTKIWEKELELVCTDREFLTMQEDLIADLEDDLEKANQTMNLVEQATRQQNNQASTPGSASALPLRGQPRNIPTIDTGDVDPHKAKDGVLGQVRALQPNHEDRLEAIERAEKARLRELEGRQRDAAFKRELASFVDEGKLKKSGGVDEAERIRLQKDERAMKDEFEDQQKRKAERAKARAEERARLAAAAQTAATRSPSYDEGEGDGREGSGEEGEEEEEMEDAQEENEGTPAKKDEPPPGVCKLSPSSTGL